MSKHVFILYNKQLYIIFKLDEILPGFIFEIHQSCSLIYLSFLCQIDTEP